MLPVPAISIDVSTYALNQKEYNQILSLVVVLFILSFALANPWRIILSILPGHLSELQRDSSVAGPKHSFPPN